MAGTSALLLDASGQAFSEIAQRKVWALSRTLRGLYGITETAPGMNNLLVLFNPLETSVAGLREILLDQWRSTDGQDLPGKSVEFQVVYGGPGGEDLAQWAAHCGYAIDEAVRRHASNPYRVAAIGSMPGSPYLYGLDPTLAMPRRTSPRLSVDSGTVIVGGQQAGVLPTRAPCGWNLIGRTERVLFDSGRSPPSLLEMGDEVRFAIADIQA